MTTELKPNTTETTHGMQLPNPLPGGIAKLAHLGVIRAVGADAATFLQGQLTQDVVLLGLNEARLAAFCSAKGRMQASFTVFKRPSDIDTSLPPEILMLCSHDILASTLKRLSMFVMRAKVKLTDATADFALYGLAGSALKNTIDTIVTIAPQAINTPAGVEFKHYFKADTGVSTLISLYPAFGQPRGLWVTPAAEPAPAGDALSPELWAWGEVHSGIATITAPIVEAFVPQMLNYESVGGVNFKKGCYPGQEVVARSQFRGTLKRRAYLVNIDDENAQPVVGSLMPFVGQEIFHDSDAEQPCGTVAQVAANPEGGYSAIVSMQVSASASGKLTLGSASGPEISLLALPYDLLEDI